MKPEKKIKKYFDSVSVPSSRDILPDEAFGSEQFGYVPKKKSLGRQFVNGVAYAAVALTLMAVICAAVVMPSLSPRVQPGDGEAESKAEESKADETQENERGWSCWLRKTGKEEIDGLVFDFDKLDSGVLNMTANEKGKRYVQVYRISGGDQINGDNEFHTDEELSALSLDETVAAIVPAFWQCNVVSNAAKRLCIVNPLARYALPAEAEKYIEEYSASTVVTEQNEDIYLDGIPTSFAAMLEIIEAYGIDEKDYIGAYEYKPLFGSHPEYVTRWLGYFMIYADAELEKDLLADDLLVARLDPISDASSQIGYIYTPADEMNFVPTDDPKTNGKDTKNIGASLAREIDYYYYRFLLDNDMLDPSVKEEDIYVQKYFGTYHGCSVVYMGGDMIAVTEAERDVEVGGHVITFRDGQICWVYNDGKFHTVSEAYEKGLINDNDVLTFGPLVSVEDLNPKDIPAEILAAWFEKFGYYNIADPYIDTLYRTENGGYVVLIVNREALYNDVFITMDLYGYELCFGNSNLPLYYENGELYDFDECPLTEKDAKELAKIFGNSHNSAIDE